MLDNKNPLIINLDDNTIGTFVGFRDKNTTENTVIIEFVPLNSFFAKSSFTRPINENCIKTIRSKNKPTRGVEEEIIYIYEGGDDSLINILDQRNIETIKTLKNTISELKMQLSSEKSTKQDIISGQASTMSMIDKIQKKSELNINPNNYNTMERYNTINKSM